MATGGCGNSGDYYLHFNDFRFQDEFQSLMGMDHENTSSSFTALLGLPPNKAMELLHQQDVPVPAGKADLELETQGSVERNPKFLDFPPPLRFSPTFPSNMELVERAAKFSVFSADLSSPSSTSLPLNSTNNSSSNVKPEPSDSDSSRRTHQNHGPPEKNKVKSDGKKKKKKRKNDGGGGEEKAELPYIHVRARPGQATDSHSLAERARREKINARMKFLQELVPGCRKISGTALVLEEIINHVQSLQRQVEFLSMRLASVNPRIDYGVLDRFLAAEDASATDGDGVVDVVRRKQLEQNWQLDLLQPTSHHQFSSLQVWDRDDDNQQQQKHGLVINPGPSLFCFDSANSAPLQVNQLKTEM